MFEREGLVSLAVAAVDWAVDDDLSVGQRATASRLARLATGLAGQQRVEARGLHTARLMACHLRRSLAAATCQAGCTLGQCDDRPEAWCYGQLG